MANHIFLVSYPRSGQHYSQRLLERVSGQNDYCEFYNCHVPDCPGKTWPLHRKTPCPAGRRIQKSHDFDLNFPILDDARYAVLVRRPLKSIVSYYEHSSRSGRGVNIDGEIHPHSTEALHRFCEAKAQYWRDFAARWLDLAETRNTVRLFQYESLIAEPNTILDFCDFVLSDYPRDIARHVAEKQLEAVRDGRVGQGKTLDKFGLTTDGLLPIVERVIGYPLLGRAGLVAFA